MSLIQNSTYHWYCLAQLSLLLPPRKRRNFTSQAGIVHLQLEVSSASRIASTELKTAKQDILHLELSQPAGTAGSSVVATVDDALQISDNDLLKSLENLLSKLDAFVSCVDVISEVCSARYLSKFFIKYAFRFIHTPVLHGRWFRRCTRYVSYLKYSLFLI